MKNFEQQRGQDRKHPSQMLKEMLDMQSRKTNTELEKEYGLNGLLKSDATIDPCAYSGLYSEDIIKADANLVRERELEFSSANNPDVQRFYRETHNANTPDEIVAKWRENKSKEKSGQMEMAITILLSEKLGKDFLVVRTAPYDDYKNGVDNLILDRFTGEVVGAFDEVHEGGNGQRTEEKKEKIKKIAKRGGSQIRYGLKLIDGKLTRANLENVPVFYLGLESGELMELVRGLGEGSSEKKDRIFKKLILSLETQRSELENSASSSVFRAKLTSFGKSLSRLTSTEKTKEAV